MDILELQTIIADLENGASVENFPVESTAETLSSGEGDRLRNAAYAIRLAAEEDAAAVAPISWSILRQLRVTEPSVRSDLIRTISLIGDHKPEILDEASGSLIEGLSASDAEVRVQSALATKTLAGAWPTTVGDNVGVLLDRLEDPNPRVRAVVFETLAELANEGEQTATEAIPLAVDALTAGNTRVRTNALHFLTNVVESNPESVAPYVDDIQVALSDPNGLARSNAAYLMAHVGGRNPETVAPYLEDVVNLLSDPEESARGNGSFALLEVGNELPNRLPIERIGDHLAELLDTPIVSVQENAVYLTALIVRHDRNAIASQGVVNNRIEELRSDSVVDVPNDVFGLIIGDLDAGQESIPEPTDNSENERLDEDLEGSRDNSVQQDRDETQQNPKTDIFNTSTTMSCRGCGIDLTKFADPEFCPNCGKDL